MANKLLKNVSQRVYTIKEVELLPGKTGEFDGETAARLLESFPNELVDVTDPVNRVDVVAADAQLQKAADAVLKERAAAAAVATPPVAAAAVDETAKAEDVTPVAADATDGTKTETPAA